MSEYTTYYLTTRLAIDLLSNTSTIVLSVKGIYLARYFDRPIFRLYGNYMHCMRVTIAVAMVCERWLVS